MFIRKASYALSTILAPNGINDSLAILKNCIPNGIPTIVMHQRQPNSRFAIAISKEADPYDVYKERKRPAIVHDFSAERPKRKFRKFKTLYANRYSDYCYAEYASCKTPCKSAKQTSE